MKSLKPLLLSFSLLAFSGAYAQDAKKDENTAAKPAMSQAETKDDKAAGSAATSPSQSAQQPSQSSQQPSQSSQSAAGGSASGATGGASTAGKNDDSSSGAAASQAQQGSGASSGASSSASGAGTAGGMSVRNLRGMDVVDSQGKNLGKIDEVMLDMANGRVHSVVLGFGGFLGLGEKNFAFPVSDLQPAKEKNKLQLNVDKEKLKDREGFAKGKYPATSDEYWARVGQSDKASAGAGQPGQKQNIVRASEVMGKDVQDKSGQDVGEVRDILLSSDRTRIEHVVLNVEGAGNATIPPKSLSMGKEGKQLVVDMSADQLKSQAKPADRNQRSERTRPTTSGSAGAGASSGSGTTRTVPIERPSGQKDSSK